MNNDFLPVSLIQTFVAFVEAANISEAAENLGISQPAVSVHLKKMEELLPHPVFIAQGKRKTLSRYGRALYDQLAPQLHQLNRGVGQVNRTFAKPQSLRVGGQTELLSRVLQISNNTGALDLLDLNDAELIVALEKNEIDLALSFQTTLWSSLFRQQKIGEEGVKLCVHKSLVKKPDDLKNPAWLAATPLIAAQNPPKFVDNWLRHLGLTTSLSLNVKYQVPDWRAALILLEMGLGYIVLPSLFHVDSNNITILELPGEAVPPQTIYAYYRTGTDPAALLGQLSPRLT